MRNPGARLRLKTRIFTAIVVVTNVFGDFSLSLGLKKGALDLSLSPLPYIKALFSPWVALGVMLLILWLLSRMALLSWADLSYVLPVTSIGYVLAAVMGKVFLSEAVSLERWAGTLLIVAGVSLVSSTPHRTTAHPMDKAA